jgi:hypothetical protein
MKEGEPKKEYFEILNEWQNNGHRRRTVRTKATQVRSSEEHYFELEREEIHSGVWQKISEKDLGPVGKGQ